MALDGSALPEERVDHRAPRHGAAITPGRHPLEDALDFPEIGHLAINLPGVLHGDALDLRARVSPPVDEAQERPDLVEREPEFPAAANEAQTLHVVLAIDPMLCQRLLRVSGDSGVRQVDITSP